MRIFEAIKKAKDILIDAGTPQLDAEVILAYLLDSDRIHLYVNRDKELTEEEIKRYFELIEERRNGKPVQYIVSNQEFMGLDFFVKEGVLIPRGDTEILAEYVIDKLKLKLNPFIIDVGCGSGAIGIAIAKYVESSKVYALDISEIPLEVTKINGERLEVSDKLTVLKSDMLKSLPEELKGKVDVIVSNPPYIRNDVIPTLMKEVKDFEPYNALSGGEDGLYFYREITLQSVDFLKDGGLLAYEIGYDQREDVEGILRDNGFKDVVTLKDLAGLDRVVVGYKL